MLSTADRVVDGDGDSWRQEWIATAQRLATIAEGCGDKQDFDRFFDQGMQSATPAERQNWEWRAKPYGLDSPFDVVDQITTPLLITDPEGEQATRRSASRASAGIVRRPRRSASGIRH